MIWRGLSTYTSCACLRSSGACLSVLGRPWQGVNGSNFLNFCPASLAGEDPKAHPSPGGPRQMLRQSHSESYLSLRIVDLENSDVDESRSRMIESTPTATSLYLPLSLAHTHTLAGEDPKAHPSPGGTQRKMMRLSHSEGFLSDLLLSTQPAAGKWRYSSLAHKKQPSPLGPPQEPR